MCVLQTQTGCFPRLMKAGLPGGCIPALCALGPRGVGRALGHGSLWAHRLWAPPQAGLCVQCPPGLLGQGRWLSWVWLRGPASSPAWLPTSLKTDAPLQQAGPWGLF